MVAPVVTVTLGGTDISTRVKGQGGSLTYGRGANFDGSGETPGYAILRVANNDKAFNPRNGAGPLAAVLKIGATVRVTAVHNAVTYYLFHGFLRRVVPLDDKLAELHCADALFNFSRREVNVAASVSRSISAFRGAILDDMGEAGANRSLEVVNGAEATIVYTGADDNDAMGLLTDLNRATGAVHYIKPTSTAYQYTTLDRTTLQGRASIETWSDTDNALPFAESLGSFDYTDERVINKQRVEAAPRLLEEDAVMVWSKAALRVGASVTRVRWARFDEPTFQQVLSYTVESGSGTATLTAFARSAKITMTSGVSGLVIKDVSISGKRALEAELDAGISEDLTSQAAYGVLAGPTISSPYISSEGYAEALANWYIYRYATPRATPSPTFVNRFPTQLEREVAERITWTASEHSVSNQPCLIRAFETSVKDSGATWETTYQLEEMPFLVSVFTLGGTAAQGIGGSAVLGF